jgi:hypothetical protein
VLRRLVLLIPVIVVAGIVLSHLGSSGSGGGGGGNGGGGGGGGGGPVTTPVPIDTRSAATADWSAALRVVYAGFHQRTGVYLFTTGCDDFQFSAQHQGEKVPVAYRCGYISYAQNPALVSNSTEYRGTVTISFASDGSVVWSATTPVPTGSGGRTTPTPAPVPTRSINPLCGHEYVTVGTSSLGTGARIFIYGPGFNGYAGTGVATVYVVPGYYTVKAYFYNGDLGREGTGRLDQCTYLDFRW